MSLTFAQRSICWNLLLMLLVVVLALKYCPWRPVMHSTLIAGYYLLMLVHKATAYTAYC